MASVLTNYWGNAILSAWFVKYGTWVGLHSGDPGVTGDTSSEAVGFGYERQFATWDNPSAKTAATNVKLVFAAMPAFEVAYISFSAHMNTGPMYCSLELDDSITVDDSAMFIVPAGDIALVL